MFNKIGWTMIHKDLKISELLREYPGSLDILLKASPHFSNLQNEQLREKLAGRVTVEQAASIAGIEANDLLYILNENCAKGGSNESMQNGENMVDKISLKDETEKTAETRRNPNDFDSTKKVYLDVRPIINSGKDPLKHILDSVKVLRNDEVLVIINSFEPIPLYSLLATKGFEHSTEKVDEAFKVYFYKKSEGTSSPEAKPGQVVPSDDRKSLNLKGDLK
jgi:uncharacterized protein (DUF2249 family)